MPFTKTERVHYEKNPLDSVICQVRFPSILRIETELPTAFQEKIVQQFPILTEHTEMLLDIQMGKRPIITDEEIKQTQAPSIKNYEFASEDNKWKINLARNFLSLTTNDYKRWEDFRSRFELALSALVEVYKPTLFNRVGLRYLDVIVRSHFGIKDVDWAELINAPYLGMISSTEIKDLVMDFQARLVIGLKDDPGVVRVITGIVKTADSQETCFMIDSDFYDIRRLKPGDLSGRIELFHSKAYGLFRSCITDRLHKVMKPEVIK